MPINIQWFDDTKRIILWKIEGQWTLDELHQAYSDGNLLCAQEPQNIINALIDMTATKAIPSNIFSALTTRVRTEMPNYDMAVIVSTSAMIKGFINVINTVPALRGQFVVVPTLEAALAYIEKRRTERAAVKG